MSTVRRCPSGRENREIRVFMVEGRTAVDPEIVVQVFQRHGHEISAPWGPTAAAIRIPMHYAPRLAELLLELAAEVERFMPIPDAPTAP